MTRRIKTPVQLDPELRERLQEIADAEHEGNLSRTLRELIRAGLEQRADQGQVPASAAR